MIDFYSAIITIIWIALIILCMLVYDNRRMTPDKKQAFYLTYSLIFLASMAEWVGIRMNGNMNIPGYVLHFVKCCDYILTPLAGAAFVAQLRIKSIWTKILHGIVLFNVLFQFASLFTDWTVYIDGAHTYNHGSLYWIYMLVYLLITIIVVIQFRIYDKRFKIQNRFTLYLIMGFVLIGIFMQEFFGSEIRTAYLGFTIGAFMMYIHSTEFAQQRSDEHILEQQIKIKTDALTGLLSRHAYSAALDEYKDNMPQDFIAFSIDVNGLKKVNDTWGHEAGDDLICAAARLIERVYGKYGECFRTGGDEFIVLAQMNSESAGKSVDLINRYAGEWHNDHGITLSLSIGYAALNGRTDLSCEALIREADSRMYDAKDEHYRVNGIGRRS